MVRHTSFATILLVALAAAPAAASEAPPAAHWQLRGFVGAASDLGSRGMAVTRLRNTQTNTQTSAGTALASASTVPSLYAPSLLADSIGLLAEGRADWLDPSGASFGAGMFGAWLGASLTTQVLALEGQPTSTYLGSSADGTSTSLSEMLTVRPLLPGVNLNNYTVTTVALRGNPPTPLGNTVVTSTYTGFTSVASAPGLALSQGSSTTGNPATSYDSKGGASYEHARTLLLDEVDLHGALPVWREGAGRLDLVGGLVFPVGSDRHSFTARTVGDKGAGDVATQVSTVTTDAAGADVYAVTTSWRLHETITTQADYLGVGPWLGLEYGHQAAFGDFYVNAGYVPVLAGGVTNLYQVALDNQVTETTEIRTGSPGVTASTKVNALASTTPSQTQASLSGTEMRGALGAHFQFRGVRLTAEGQVRAYNMVPLGNQAIYGLRLGGEIGF